MTFAYANAWAAQLTYGGFTEWRLPTIRDIVVYPTSFTEQSYEITDFGHTLGMVHAQGPILFSLPALLRAYPPLGPEGERGQGDRKSVV